MISNKLGHFNEESIARAIHEYLIQLPEVHFKDTAQAPVIGYRRVTQRYNFATLQGEPNFQSLVLFVEPGNPTSTIGKQIQREVQERLTFDIGVIRNHILKSHEVYIPLEKLDKSNPIENIKDFIDYAYHQKTEL